jgi:hypothetical protein
MKTRWPDDIGFLAKRLPLDREHFKGVVINKVMNVSDFTDSLSAEYRENGDFPFWASFPIARN